MKTYPLTPMQFSALRTKLLSLGVTLPSDTEGTLNYKGIALRYYYHVEAGRLILDIQDKPMFAPASMIWEKVDEWMASL